MRTLYIYIIYIKKDIQCGSTSGWAPFADAALAAGLSTDICKASKLYYHTNLQSKQTNWHQQTILICKASKLNSNKFTAEIYSTCGWAAFTDAALAAVAASLSVTAIAWSDAILS